MRKHYSTIPEIDDHEKFEDSPGRQKMSDDVTTRNDPNSDYGDAGDGDNAVSFSDADGVPVGLSRRSPMNYIAKDRDSLGVNSLSRRKYNGS